MGRKSGNTILRSACIDILGTYESNVDMINASYKRGYLQAFFTHKVQKVTDTHEQGPSLIQTNRTHFEECC